MIKMKLIAVAAIFLSSFTLAQIGVGTSTPDQSSILDLSSNSKGFLPPRVPLASANDATTIPNPATGLVVYNTNAGFASVGLYLNIGTSTVPDWRMLQLQRPGGTAIEYTSLDISPLINLNAYPNDDGTWREVTALRQNLTISQGANIKTVVTASLNSQASSGLAQCDLLVKITPGSAPLASTLPINSSNPRDAFGLLTNNGNGLSVSINAAKSTVATIGNYVIQVYIYRGNTPNNLPSYSLTPFYINTLVTK